VDIMASSERWGRQDIRHAYQFRGPAFRVIGAEEGVAASQDYADVLPLVRVRSAPCRVVHELREPGYRRAVTVVIAAAGYGKTSLLASWASRTTSGWLRCTGVAQSGGEFLQTVVEALAPHAAGLPVPQPRVLERPDQIERAVISVCEWLRASPDDHLVLVVDDVQELPAELVRVTNVLPPPPLTTRHDVHPNPGRRCPRSG
jgi:hypothetical protein